MDTFLAVPLEERERYWAYQHGEFCMEIVLSLCQSISEINTSTAYDIQVKYGLLVVLYTIYGRAFITTR
jgi:hypothetical protein